MRRPRVLTVLIGMCVLASVIRLAEAGPPPIERDMPGDPVAKIKTWWLAPYVNVTSRSVGPDRWTAIDWLNSDGKLLRKLAGDNVYAQSGFVFQNRGDTTTVYSVVGDWKFDLPEKPGPAGYICGTDRTFVHEFHPQEGQIAADIYTLGKLVGTIGPYTQLDGQDVRLGEDGSLALVTWKNNERKVGQIIAVGPDGKNRIQTDCDAMTMSPMPAPGGDGVLARLNGGENRDQFTFYRKSGRVSSMVVGPNGELAAWLPGASAALMQTSVGYEHRWRLIDWQTGKQLWEIAELTTNRLPGSGTPTIAVGNLLLIGGLEVSDEGQNKVSSRRIYALDVRTGRIAAHWTPSPPNMPASDVGYFYKLGGKLYLVTEGAFTEIKVNEITAKVNGWK